MKANNVADSKRSWKKNKRCNRKRWGRYGPKYWVFLSTLTAAGLGGAATMASAQQSSASAASQPNPERRRVYNIAPGPLDAAILAFETISGLRVEVSSKEIGAVASPGISGFYTPEEALRALVTGTGITYHLTDSNTAVLQLEQISTSVDVTAAAPELGPSSAKLTEPLRDTPQSIDLVSRQVLEQQNPTTLRDALRNVAGISLAAGEGGAQGDSLTIRGFSARNDLFMDGMRDFGSYYRDPFNTEQVEVLQGPSSVMFGRGSTGGVVNQASKTPTLGSRFSADLDLGTDRTRRVTADINEPLSALGPAAAFRLNVMGTEANVAGRDVTENRRFGIAPSMALGIGTATRWTFSYLHQSENDIPDYGIPWLFNGPAPVDRHNYYGFRDGNVLRTSDDIGTARWEHDVNSHVTMRDQVRYARYQRHALITEAQIPTTVTASTPLDSIVITRNEIATDSMETYLDEQLDVTANFKTGGFEHTLVSGIEVGRETSDPTRPKYINVPGTSLLDPDPDQPFSGTPVPSSKVSTTAISGAAYALDTVKIGRRWQATVGIRWDRFDTDYQQFIAPASAFSRVDEIPSWRAALVFKPVSKGSVYIASGTSFNPSAESLSLSAANANLPPEKNRTVEAGTKWDLGGGKLSVHSAVFTTDKTNAREPDPLNPLLNVLAGKQRVSGVEAGIDGRITNRWEILSSYAYLDGKTIGSNYYPAAVGAPLANTPRHTFNFWTEYYFPRHWEGGFGGDYVSSRTASSTAPFDPITGLLREAPGYWVFNAMVRHPIAEHIDFQLNFNNLMNRYYYDQLHPAHIVPGPGRSVLAELKFRF